jgi:hypothetical protein
MTRDDVQSIFDHLDFKIYSLLMYVAFTARSTHLRNLFAGISNTELSNKLADGIV